MTRRIHNFNPGPAALPASILEQAQAELLDYDDTGLSILEISHRSDAYERIHERVQINLKRLLGLGDEHSVLLMAGGARTQFAAVPMNLRAEGQSADYLLTGRWSRMAYDEATKQGSARATWTLEDKRPNRVPDPSEYDVHPDAAYLHVTCNNTVFGTQLPELPNTGDVPLVSDISSEIASRRLDYAQFGLAYAGAQKNLGPAGVTIVIVRSDLLERSPDWIPDMLNYRKIAGKRSLLNTPPVFAVHLVHLVVQKALDDGGLATIEERNRGKARLIYDVIDHSEGFYRPHAARDSRSIMNVTFGLPTPDLDAQFVEESQATGLIGLKGHRSVGGLRVSLYNWVPTESAEALADFMREFQRRHS